MVENEKVSGDQPIRVARVRVPDDLWHRVRVAAASRRVSIQDYAADALRAATERDMPATSQMATR